MGRYQRNYVEYYPQDTAPGDTEIAIEEMFGNDGYAVMHKTVRKTLRSPGLFLDCSIDANWLKLVGKFKVAEEKALAILGMMARFGFMDKDLWENHRVIWLPAHVKRLHDAFRNRVGADGKIGKEVPGKPSFESSTKEDDAVAGNEGKNISDVRNDISSVRKAILSAKRKEIEKKQTTTILSDSGESDGKKKVSPDSSIPFAEIIECLNVNAGSSFRATTEGNKKYIRARWNEGNRMSDFALVIKHMCGKWKCDPKMAHLLRPKTLFNSENFEGYLAEAKRCEKDTCPLEKLIDIWNANSPPLVPYAVRSRETDDAIRATYNLHINTLERWTEFVEGCKSSDLLSGKATGWRPTIGWVVTPTHFSDIINTDGYRKVTHEELF